MGTLLDDDDRNAILARLDKLAPDTSPRWGRLDAPCMLCHITDQLRVALGDIPAKRSDSYLKRTLLKWLVVDTGFKAPPGKVMTAPEMLTSKPGE